MGWGDISNPSPQPAQDVDMCANTRRSNYNDDWNVVEIEDDG